MPSLLDVRRTAAALVAVALSAALIAFAFIVSDSYTTRMRADARLSLGGADAVVVPARPSEGGGPLDDAVIAQLSDLDGVTSVRGEHWDIIYPDLPRQLANAVGAIAAQDVPVLSERTTLTAGRLPQGPGEVAIDTSLAEKWELGVGDAIRLRNNESGDIRKSKIVFLPAFLPIYLRGFENAPRFRNFLLPQSLLTNRKILPCAHLHFLWIRIEFYPRAF